MTKKLRRSKNVVELGFSLKKAGMSSREAVVRYLDEEQREWESKNPTLMPSQIEDRIMSGGNCIMGGTCWAGFRLFKPVRRPKPVISGDAEIHFDGKHFESRNRPLD